MENLRKYLKKVVKEDKTPVAHIARASGGTITDSYIFDIMSGKTKHISVEKLQALALGLGIDPPELFKIVTGYTPADDTSQDITQILRIILDMNPKERKALLTYLKKKQTG